ncbi:serine hydrolase domain-containing protein [Mycobacterium intracellulare]|uniref:Beta-lactamase-related domain-containing protein n=1 Tax=Mycobacterium intracellulare TaxID=1767 RepID=A0A7R7MYU4_MYCIT|nr:serine hydrolase domain-containing protein [Mycobacterium intracellulare]BCP02507.1 hypothetical protein MINTM018_52760 [Mycobacterium intracellulare]
MAISPAGALTVTAVSAGGSTVDTISAGDQVVWAATPPNDQVPYTVPFAVVGPPAYVGPSLPYTVPFDVVGPDVPLPEPTMVLTSARSDSLSVAASGYPEEEDFGPIAGYNFYVGGTKNNSTVELDGAYTYTGLTNTTAYTLTFTFVNGSGTESAHYGSLSASTIAASREIPLETESAIDGYVADGLKPNTKVDGCLVGIYTPDFDFYKAYGGDRTTGLMLSTDMRMRYGSVTKMYTALLILAQIDAGNLSLDDKLSQFVDGVANGDIITIKHLLQMQSGIKDYLQQDAAVQQIYFLTPTVAFDPMPYIRSYTPLYEPGTQSSYSNSNYILLGKILEWLDAEHGTGRDISTIIREDLLEPQGLSETEWPTGDDMTAPYSRGWETNLALPVAEASAAAAEASIPFLSMLFPDPLSLIAFLQSSGLGASFGIPPGLQLTPEIEGTSVNPDFGGAAGCIDGTIADLVKFGQVLGSAPMLSPEMKQLRDEDFVTYLTYVPSGANGPGWMGFGLGVIQWGSWLGWIGNLVGYHSVVFVNQDDGSVIAAIMNHMDGDPLTLFYNIAYLLNVDSTELREQTIRVDTVSVPEPTVKQPTVFVYHTPGDEDGNTAVPLKVPFYV